LIQLSLLCSGEQLNRCVANSMKQPILILVSDDCRLEWQLIGLVTNDMAAIAGKLAHRKNLIWIGLYFLVADDQLNSVLLPKHCLRTMLPD